MVLLCSVTRRNEGDEDLSNFFKAISCVSAEESSSEEYLNSDFMPVDCICAAYFSSLAGLL